MAFWNTSYGVSFMEYVSWRDFYEQRHKSHAMLYFLNKPTTFCTRFTASCCVGFCFRANSTCTK